MKNLQITVLFLLCSQIISAGILPGSAKGTDAASAQSDRIVFAVIGDYGMAGQPAADVASLVKSWNPDFIVTTGDNNQSGRPYEIDDHIGPYYHEFIFQYDGKYGPGSPTRRFFPSIGNHDWAGDSVQSYLNYFHLREYERYYDFVQGPVHFFMLDSDRHEPDGVTSKSQQAIWLRKALAASTSTYNIVVFHHPPYSSGWHGSTDYMQWPFKEWGADVILSGHDHLYERLLVDGMPYFINGLGGDEIYRFETVLPESRVRFNLDHGAMRVEATALHIKFQMITRTGLLVDEYVFSNSIPRVSSITRMQVSPSNSAIVDFSVTFSEPVQGVDVSDFNITANNITGASILSVVGTGKHYTVSVNTGTGEGNLRLDLIDDDSITNEHGNKLGELGAGNGSFSAGDMYTFDRTPPHLMTLTRVGAAVSNANAVEYLATFSEPVDGVDISDFQLTSSIPNAGDVITSLNHEGNSYRIVINTGIMDHILGIDFIDNDSVKDAVGNSIAGTGMGNGNLSASETQLIDKTVPVVSSIIRAGTNPTTSATTDFVVTFSEPVTGVDTSDFLISANNLTSASVIAIQNVDPFYVVTVNTGTGAGTLRLDLIDNDSILDAASNTTGGFGSGNGNFSGGEAFDVDKGPPMVWSISRAGSTPSNASMVDFIVTFSETVTGVDVSDFKLASEMVINSSIFNVSGSGSTYTVTATTGEGDGTIRLDLVDDNSIFNINGVALAGNGIEDGGFYSGEVYSMDRTIPLVTSILRGNASPIWASTVDYVVTFSEPISGLSPSDFVAVVSNGMQQTSIRSVTSFDPFYVVTVNTGIGNGTLQLAFVDEEKVVDRAGNPIGGIGRDNGNFTFGETYEILKASTGFIAPSMRGSLKSLLTNDTTPVLDWSAVRGAIAYEITVSSDSNFNSVIASQVTNSPAFEFSSPLADGLYYWRVRAYNASMEAGKFSTILSFTVDTVAPAAPALLAPANNIVASTRPHLQWEKLSSAVKYHVQIDNNPDFSSPVFTTERQDTSFKMPKLARGTYYWRVRANDQLKNMGNWSVVFTFNVP